MLVLGFPVWQLTYGREKWRPLEDTAQQGASEEKLRCDIYIRSAHLFDSVTLTISDSSVQLSGEELEMEAYLPVTNELVIGQLTIVWPEGTPETALELELIPDGLPERKVTVWGSGSLEETVEFDWEGEEL